MQYRIETTNARWDGQTHGNMLSAVLRAKLAYRGGHSVQVCCDYPNGMTRIVWYNGKAVQWFVERRKLV